MNIYNEVNFDDYMILFILLCFKILVIEYLINYINFRFFYINLIGIFFLFIEFGGINVCSYLVVVKRKYVVLLMIIEICR